MSTILTPSDIIAMTNDQLDDLCATHAKLSARLAAWEDRFEMGPDWVGASLTAMARERQAADIMAQALDSIKHGLADDAAYRNTARKAIADAQAATEKGQP